MRQANAKEIKTCVLLRKLDIKTNAQIPDYIGFDIPNKFVFDYGLDAYESHRNLKEIHYITEQ
jgi:hypoxanthine-guanine phosphoribosyltransferase